MTRSAITGSDTPTVRRVAPAGLASGPRKLNVVGVPSWLRTGAAKRIAGWNRWAKQNPMPTSRTQRATPSGPRSMTTPSASSTSTDPHFDDAARPPCLATRAPAAAVTTAAMVDTLTVPAPSPPVPHVSTSGRIEIGEVDVLGELEHRAHQRGELAGGLALGAQADGERGDLRIGRVARQDLRHGLLDEVIREVLAPEQTPDDVGPQRCVHPPDATGDDRGRRPARGRANSSAPTTRSCGAGARGGAVRARRARPRRPASPGP